MSDGVATQTVEDDLEQLRRDDAEAASDLSPELLDLRGRVRKCLAYYYRRCIEDVTDRSPWGIMHNLIAYGVDTEVYANGQRVNAIGWLCWNRPCRGQQLFYVHNGLIHPRLGPGVEGHSGQFLAMLAQSRVRKDYKMKVDGYEVTVANLIEYEKLTCRPATELTFKLIGLVHYLDSDESWKSQDGEQWDIPRLIKEELAQPIIGATCGGTHRLMGFSYAVRKRQKRSEPIDGQWLRAKKYLDAYHEYTFKLQNPDGSFSTDWFRGRGDWGGPDRHAETTGHILEWLAFSVPKSQLRDPRVVKAVDYLTRLLMNDRTFDWDVGALGHALHALAIYDERVFGSKPGQRPFLVAERHSD